MMNLSELPLSDYHLQILETLIVILAIIITRKVSFSSIRRIGTKYNFQSERIFYTKKLIALGYYSIGIIFILFIWGVDQRELLVFMSSFVAILGVGFFAQWSLLSNVTSSIILYVNHPAKVGDHITIADKEFPIQGRIEDIGAFFVTIVSDNGETITVPNSIFFQKMINLGVLRRD